MFKKTLPLTSLALVFVLTACDNASQSDQQATQASKSPLAQSDKKIQADPEKSTFARFVPERKDDFAWENDMIAFRAYGPALRDGGENAGVDCWLKRVEYPIINKWYRLHDEQGISYHEDHGEGLDNYHVGSSAGCGGTAIWLNGERQALEAYTSYNIISQTPEKTVFELTYENDISGDTYGETKRITIELGNRLYKAESTFTKNGEVAANIPIAVGVTTHDGKANATFVKDEGIVMAWETLDGSGLGTAVIVEPGSVIDAVELSNPEVKDFSHALLIVNTDENGKLSYASGYGWEKAGVITTPAQWQDYLESSQILE